MKAIQFSSFGPAWEVAEIVDLPDPGPPGPGEVVVDILASPINPSDFLNFEGRFGAYAPALPAAAGGEAVGRVSAVGPGVDHLRVGDRVLAVYAGRGNWRERIRTPAAGMFALPAEADTLQLAMLAVNPGTAWRMLEDFAALAPGDWVLQNAANSAVGQNVIKLARRRGVRTVNIVRRDDQAARLQAIGANAIVPDGPDLRARIAKAVDDAPVRLAFDAVAGPATGTLVRAVADSGSIVIYGVLSGETAQFDPADVLFRDVAVRGFWFSAWFRKAALDEKRRLYDRLVPLLLDGALGVPVEATYPLTEVKAALAHAAQGGRSGKILLVMNA